MNTDSEYLCFVNGDLECNVSARDRGLAYGHGLFETVKVHSKIAPLLEYHIQRLINGAERIGIEVSDALVRQYFSQLLRASPEEGIIKIIVTAGISPAGYVYTKSGLVSYILQWFPMTTNYFLHKKRGISLKNCKHRLTSSSVLAGIKHLNRLDQVIARAEWSDEYYDGLMLDQSGCVVECVSSNIFLSKDGVWYTPDTLECGVTGVMRRYIIDDLIPSICGKVKEGKLSMDALISADEVFVCNSINGIFPVVSLEDSCSWVVGTGTAKLQNALYSAFPCYR